MSVLVDTCVWSLALRRHRPETTEVVTELRDLIVSGRAGMIGPIRQELLSGIKQQAQYERLRERLRAFPDLEVVTEDYERAAEYFNICRGQGVQGSNTDFLICTVAERLKMPIFTTDKDFLIFSQHLPCTLFEL